MDTTVGYRFVPDPDHRRFHQWCLLSVDPPAHSDIRGISYTNSSTNPNIDPPARTNSDVNPASYNNFNISSISYANDYGPCWYSYSYS